MRNLIIVLGDQLDLSSAALQAGDPAHDVIWMAEVDRESTHVWAHQLRIAVFLSAMRHFRNELESRNWTVSYHELTANPRQDRGRSFGEVLSHDIAHWKPDRLIVVEPGDDRVTRELQQVADTAGLELCVLPDEHFYCSTEEFREYASGRRSFRLEYFYREMRRRHRVLIDDAGEPVGGKWNFDHDNRESFGRQGPGKLPRPMSFRPDSTTQEVLQLVAERFGDHPGRLDEMTLPVTRRQARAALKSFVETVLPQFGCWEDAMWTDEPFLYHSRLSVPLNLKLLNPRECVDAAVRAWQSGAAPLNSVEGFVRQILGWREFVRGIYWLKMPEYAALNALDHQQAVPSFFWDGQTEMNCVRQSMQHVLAHGYSHHIHRLMVLGNFAQLWGVHPLAFHEWHMAMYLDAIDWVSLPNTLGMSQYGDGGIVGTKPYCSSGNYIHRMSNFCSSCRFDYRRRTGDTACPFTTLYWEFLDRHEARFRDNPRMKFAMKNLQRLREDAEQMAAIRQRAAQLRNEWSA